MCQCVGKVEGHVCSKCVSVLGRWKDTCAVSVSVCWEGGRVRVRVLLSFDDGGPECVTLLGQ